MVLEIAMRGGRSRCPSVRRVMADSPRTPQERPVSSSEGKWSEIEGAASVLIVEDDRQVRALLELWHRARHYVVFSAGDCCSGIEQALSRRPAAILLDIRMPDGTGIDLLRALDSRGIRIPTVIFSAHATASEAFQAARLGVVEFIEKPADEESVMIAVADALRSARDSDSEAVRPAVLRIARAIVRVRRAAEDFPTLDKWAHLLLTSRGTLKGWCHAAHVEPHTALECARLLRAFELPLRLDGLPLDYLDISDQRTAVKLFRRSGFAISAPGIDAVTFMAEQRLLTDSSVCRGVLRLLKP
jgi:FixJ family two-component response regulator